MVVAIPMAIAAIDITESEIQRYRWADIGWIAVA